MTTATAVRKFLTETDTLAQVSSQLEEAPAWPPIWSKNHHIALRH